MTKRILLGFTPLFLAISGNALAEGRLTLLAQDSQPKYLLNEGRLAGLCGDIYSRLKEKLEPKGIKVVLPDHYLPIKRILKQVETADSAAYCGAGRNAAREKRFQYSSIPLYEVAKVVVTHRDNAFTPESFDDIKKAGTRVGTFFGTSSARFLKKQLGNLVNERYYDLADAMKQVAERKLPFFYYHDLGLLYLIKTSKLPLKPVPTRFRVTPHWMIYSPTMSDEMKSLVNTEIEAMVKAGEVERIWDQYRVKN